MHTVEISKRLLLQAGAAWVLWLLLALLAGAVLVAVERWLVFRQKQDDVRALAAELDAHLSSAAFDRALEALRPWRSIGANVARAGLRLAPRGLVAAERGMQSATAAERKSLESRLAFLGTLGNNAPFVGLFGTVIGVVSAFDKLGQSSLGGSASAVASTLVMSAIAEALVATAMGIGVALPAIAAYNYFQRRITAMLDDAETLSNLVLAYLASTSGEEHAAKTPTSSLNPSSARSDSEAA